VRLRIDAGGVDVDDSAAAGEAYARHVALVRITLSSLDRR
jgi:hypothetical protein